jgi:hypothetical protein
MNKRTRYIEKKNIIIIAAVSSIIAMFVGNIGSSLQGASALSPVYPRPFAPGLVAEIPGDAASIAPKADPEIGIKYEAPGQEGLDLGLIGPPKKIQ